MSEKTPAPSVDPRDAVYECRGATDSAGVFRPCGLRVVLTETGEEGWEGPYHCSKMERVGPAGEVRS